MRAAITRSRSWCPVSGVESVGTNYFFLVATEKSGCHVTILRLGAAAMTFGFSFFGFLASRLPLCWPLAIRVSLICVSSYPIHQRNLL